MTYYEINSLQKIDNDFSLIIVGSKIMSALNYLTTCTLNTKMSAYFWTRYSKTRISPLKAYTMSLNELFIYSEVI